MAKFEVNEKERTVVAYKGDVKSEKDFQDIEKYNRLNYTVTLLPKRPKKNHKHIKNDMIKYLKNNIDDEIYNKFIDGVEKGKRFLTLQWELIKDMEKKENKKIKPKDIEEIINQAKAKENKVIEKAIEQAENENKKNKNKNTSNEDK